MKNHTKEIRIKSNASRQEQDFRKDFVRLFKQCPIPDDEILHNLALFIDRQTLANIFFVREMYEQIVDVHGIIVEFGVRWGKNLALFESLRGICEPFNHNRKIVGFDTFAGFPAVHRKDGNARIIDKGAYSVTRDYERYLDKILNYHESESPIAHIKKYQLVKGDATLKLAQYLKENPETIIAFAYFDFDIYEPTKKCLEMIKGHLTKGSVIGFDELNHHDYPGETLALKEVFGLDRYKIRKSPLNPVSSYIVIE